MGFSELLAAIAPSIPDRPARNRISGLTGSAKSLAIAALVLKAPARAHLIVTKTPEEAEVLFADLTQLASADKNRPDIRLFPAFDTLPFEMFSPNRQVMAERMAGLSRLLSGKGVVLIASLKATLQKTIAPDVIKKNVREISAAHPIVHADLIGALARAGFARETLVSSVGEFSVRGGIIDFFPPGVGNPIRIEFGGDTIETIREFDANDQRTLALVEKSITILPPKELMMDTIPDGPIDGIENWMAALIDNPASLLDYLEKDDRVILDEPGPLKEFEQTLRDEVEEMRDKARENPPFGISQAVLERAAPYQALDPFFALLFSLYIEQFPSEPGGEVIDIRRTPGYGGDINALAADLRGGRSRNEKIWVVTRQSERIVEQLKELGVAPDSYSIVDGELHVGFFAAATNLRVITDAELYGAHTARRHVRAQPTQGTTSLTAPFQPGDYVVHVGYGVGQYKGLTSHVVDSATQEFMTVEYADETVLHIPMDQMGLVYAYKVPGDYTPKLARLDTARWENAKERVRRATRQFAQHLLQLYAKRQADKGFSYPSDTDWQLALERAFPYTETAEQVQSIAATKKDMESSRPMERLICGDVGYGKTEVAIRAAFKAVSAGKQVAVLVPTTLLAEQHFTTFRERFAPFPFTVEMLSRFRSHKEQSRIVKALATGGVDVIIGTHRLVQKDVAFKELGLLIIDEEQKFGVAHKERLKAAFPHVDVLTLSATPIPRTLYLSLSAIREMSVISTPPQGRTPIRTTLAPWNPPTIREAIMRELERGGQVFFVHNNIERIGKIADKVRDMVPNARVAVGHGQMDEGELERVMTRFMNRHTDILVCTTIIESGLDLPNVNTILIDHADKFGLSELYQLRGRVGRGSVPAYAYLLYHPGSMLTQTARDRLQAIRDFTALGSGYRLALRDLEIRGAGNFLGREQHGHMVAVGFDLYTKMLEQAVAELKNPDDAPPPDTMINLSISAYLPPAYVEDDSQRLDLYRRLHWIGSRDGLADFESELRDRFGPLPPPARELIALYDLKLRAAEAGITSLESKDEGLVIKLDLKRVTPQRLSPVAQKIFSSANVRPLRDGILIVPRQGLPQINKLIAAAISL